MTPRLHAVERWAREKPDQSAVVQVADGRRLTYGRLWERTQQIADAVTRLAGPRVPVAIVAPPACDFEAACLGVELADAVCAPLASDLPADEMARLLQFVEPRVVVMPASAVKRVRPEHLPTCTGAIAITEDGRLDVRRLGRAPAPLSYEVAPHWAGYRLTSGTFAVPKIVVVSKATERYRVEWFCTRMSYTAADVLASGLAVVFDVFWAQVTLEAGGVYVGGRGCSPEVLARAIAAERATFACAVPWVFRQWAASPDIHPYLRGLRFGIHIGAVPESDVRVLYERCGFVAPDRYGLSEASGMFIPVLSWAEGKMTSVGQPAPGWEVRLVTGDGRDADVGEPGELWVRGPGIMDGYLKDPEGTAAVLRDGWLRTGDLLTCDRDGYYRVVGRIKAMISVAGRKVHPEEIEAALLEHPAVAQVAVSARPHPVRGEQVHAAVILRPGRSVTARDLRRFCQARLAAYKVPRTITFVESLPTGESGKVIRRSDAMVRARSGA